MCEIISPMRANGTSSSWRPGLMLMFTNVWRVAACASDGRYSNCRTASWTASEVGPARPPARPSTFELPGGQ